jgi:hypothetical protein
MKLAAVVCLPLMLVAGALGSASWLVVDVKEADGPRILVPIPLALAQVAAALVPERCTRVVLPEEAAEILPAATRFVEELRDASDGVLVEVEDGQETVVISKVDDRLEIRVRGPRERVDVALPLETVEDILASYDGETLRAKDVVAALRRINDTDLIRVEDGDDRVKVWIW